jgi:hypothetical protein
MSSWILTNSCGRIDRRKNLLGQLDVQRVSAGVLCRWLLGAFLGLWLRGYNLDVYAQIGLIMDLN